VTWNERLYINISYTAVAQSQGPFLRQQFAHQVASGSQILLTAVTNPIKIPRTLRAEIYSFIAPHFVKA
jgi:hypothetical protein